MLKTPHPEAALLRNARHARDISTADAAAEADIDELEWVRIETDQGERAPAATFARMAHAVGIHSETLAPIRQDAAEELATIELEDRVRALIKHIPDSEDEAVQELETMVENLQDKVQALKHHTAERSAQAAKRENRMAKLEAEAAEGYGRMRYVIVVIGVAVIAVILGCLPAFAVENVRLLVAEASVPPGATVLVAELPGPFGGWVTLWWWFSLVYFVVMLPIELFKARRDKLYLTPKQARPKD